MYFNADTKRLQFYSSGGGNVYYDYVFSLNTWYHIAITINNGSASLYVNGAFKQTISYTSPGVSSPIRIGARVSEENKINASVSDFRLYNKVLSDEEIASLCKNFSTINKQGKITGNEFIESNNILINKNGTIKNPNFIENNVECISMAPNIEDPDPTGHDILFQGKGALGLIGDPDIPDIGIIYSDKDELINIV